jgi:hypothetical protein
MSQRIPQIQPSSRHFSLTSIQNVRGPNSLSSTLSAVPASDQEVQIENNPELLAESKGTKFPDSIPIKNSNSKVFFGARLKEDPNFFPDHHKELKLKTGIRGGFCNPSYWEVGI